jgi:nucleoside-diphosphate kinase
MAVEKTFIIIKPDGVERKLIGDILGRIEDRGFAINKMIMCVATEEKLRQHYHEIVDKPFFPGVLEYMTSGPIVIAEIEGADVIKAWRNMMGPTNPTEALPGTIRGDWAQGEINGNLYNLVHGSDSPDNAARELAIWF